MYRLVLLHFTGEETEFDEFKHCVQKMRLFSDGSNEGACEEEVSSC